MGRKEWPSRILSRILNICEPGSSVGIATGYGLDGPGIESRWGEIFRTCPDRPCGPHSLLYNGYRVFPVGKERPGCDADPSSLLVPWSRKRRTIPLLPQWAVRSGRSLSACTRCTLPFTLFWTFKQLKDILVSLNTAPCWSSHNNLVRANKLSSSALEDRVVVGAAATWQVFHVKYHFRTQ